VGTPNFSKYLKSLLNQNPHQKFCWNFVKANQAYACFFPIRASAFPESDAHKDL